MTYVASLIVLGMLIVFWFLDPPRYFDVHLRQFVLFASIALWLFVFFMWLGQYVPWKNR